jgi:16S rRNA (cytidine1402-2'-O)-methyltransferase
MKQLFIVATPIGNLADITFRAVETLKLVDLIVAEDTRHTGILLNKYAIEKKMTSCHAQTSPEKITQIFSTFPKEGNIAYVSDAGTPGISDPGYRIVKEALSQGFTVIPIPGASALTTLLSVAGIPMDEFAFHGFIPHKKGRQTLITSFFEAKMTHVFYESVHRFPKLLGELENILGSDRVIVVGRELTKMHEEIFRGTLGAAQSNFGKENTRGEFVVMVAPCGYKL